MMTLRLRTTLVDVTPGHFDLWAMRFQPLVARNGPAVGLLPLVTPIDRSQPTRSPSALPYEFNAARYTMSPVTQYRHRRCHSVGAAGACQNTSFAAVSCGHPRNSMVLYFP